MITVAETAAFITSAKAIGMTDTERLAAIDLIARDPAVGDVIVGSGGCRKVRVAGRGKGKSGGYRVVTFHSGERETTYLLAVLSKGSEANFTQAQINTLAKVVREISRL